MPSPYPGTRGSITAPVLPGASGPPASRAASMAVSKRRSETSGIGCIHQERPNHRHGGPERTSLARRDRGALQEGSPHPLALGIRAELLTQAVGRVSGERGAAPLERGPNGLPQALGLESPVGRQVPHVVVVLHAAVRQAEL